MAIASAREPTTQQTTAAAELLVAWVELDGERYRLTARALADYLSGRRRPLRIGERSVWLDPGEVAEYLGEAPPVDFAPAAGCTPLKVERYPLSEATVRRYLTLPPTLTTGERKLAVSPISGARIRYLTASTDSSDEAQGDGR